MGCKVHRNQHGFLFFRLFWQGRDWKEAARVRDTKSNRRKAEKFAAMVSASMQAGRFDYLSFFPHGNRVREFSKPEPVKATLRDFYQDWIRGADLPEYRRSRGRDYRQHWQAYIGPALGDVVLQDVTQRNLEDFRFHLEVERGLSPKTTKNVIGGTLRAILRDAGQGDIFEGFTWARVIEERPDPFTAAERDAILSWYYDKQRRWHPFVYTLFWTGMRPSEATGLTWGQVDASSGRISITRSRHLGGEAATKTRYSNRILRRCEQVIAVLEKPLHVTESDHVFVNTKGTPLDQNEFRKRYWYTPQRALNIRPRNLYQTRHTFISLALSAGLPAKWVAEQCGTSVSMIERRYGLWMPGYDDEAAARFYGEVNGQRKRDRLD